jgi:hypothetical protein
MAKAPVCLHRPRTAIAREINTGFAGENFSAAIARVPCRINIEATSFRSVETWLTISTSEAQTLHFHVDVIGQQTIVKVSADADTAINAFEPLHDVTRDNLDVEMLPDSGRTIVNKTTFVPGVTPTFNPHGDLTPLSMTQPRPLNANGGRLNATAHQLDFTDANDLEHGGTVLSTQLTFGMLPEFKILANNWAAEYGLKSRAEVLKVSKAGINDSRVYGYQFLQNAALSTRDSVTDPNVPSIMQPPPGPSATTPDSRIGIVAVSAPTPSDSDMYLLRGDATLSERHTLTAQYFENTGTSYNRTAGSLPGFDTTFDLEGRNVMVAETWV